MTGKILLLVGLYVVWRLVSSLLRRSRRRPTGSGTRPGPDGARPDESYDDLTSQSISDADFEEIDDSRS